MTGSPPPRVSLGAAAAEHWSLATSWPRFLVADPGQALIAHGASRVLRTPSTTPLRMALRAASSLGPFVVGAGRFGAPPSTASSEFDAFGGAFFFAPRELVRVPLLPTNTGTTSRVTLRAESTKRYDAALRKAIEAVDTGALQKVVIARAFTLHLPHGPLDPRGNLPDVLDALHGASKNARVYLLAPDPNHIWLGATPERLVRIADGRVDTEAVAGTARLGPDNLKAALELLDSPKDLREHDAVVAHLLTALETFRAEIAPPARPELRLLPGLAHLVTPISARLAPGTVPADLVAALHPSPAVNGAPFDEARAFILEHEGFDRGVYSGPIGILEPSRASFDVGLRGALLTPRGVRIFAGSGIVQGSSVAQESAETLAKAVAIVRSLGFDIADIEEAP